MRVGIRKIEEKEKEQVIIECVEVTPEIQNIQSYVRNMGEKISGFVEEETGKEQRLFKLSDVYYFEAVDEKVFAYTKEMVYELRMRLYQVEEQYCGGHFVRCSKSVVLNLMLLEGISPALNGRFFAHMCNGEKLLISRQYAAQIKQAITGGKKG